MDLIPLYIFFFFLPLITIYFIHYCLVVGVSPRGCSQLCMPQSLSGSFPEFYSIKRCVI